MSPLPKEILTKIFAQSNVDVLDDITGKLSGLFIEDFKHERKNPHNYFRTLVPDTTKFLETMTETGVVLIKSKAVEYFYPGICGIDDKWVFLSPPSRCNAMQFCLFLESLGTKLECKASALRYSNITDIISCTLNGHNVEVLVPVCSQFEFIFGLNDSIEYCMVTGSYAISIFHSLSAKGRFWSRSTKTDPGKEAVMYEQGIYTSNEFVCVDAPFRYQRPDISNAFAAPDSFVIDFKPYVDKTTEYCEIISQMNDCVIGHYRWHKAYESRSFYADRNIYIKLEALSIQQAQRFARKICPNINKMKPVWSTDEIEWLKIGSHTYEVLNKIKDFPKWSQDLMTVERTWTRSLCIRHSPIVQ